MTYTYKTQGTCSKLITLEIGDDDIISSVKFAGGCPGNTQGVARLCVGRKASEVKDMLKGVICRNGTSCPDQLAKALEEYEQNKKA